MAEDSLEDPADDETISDLDFTEVDRHVEEFKRFLADLYEEHSTFVHRLADDCRFAGNQVKEVDDQYRRRAYLRAAFEFIEGALYSRRRLVREIEKRNEQDGSTSRPELSAGELALLNEIEYELRDDGTAGVRARNFQPFLKYLRFTFAVDFKSRRQPNPVNYTDSGWEALQLAYQARNRIAHPKRIADITISDSELAALREGVQWFADQFNKR